VHSLVKRNLNMSDYYTAPILTLVVSDNYLLLLMYVGCTANQRISPFEYLLQLLVKDHFLSFLGSLQFLMRMLKDQEFS
jgi:hypothetical protein